MAGTLPAPQGGSFRPRVRPVSATTEAGRGRPPRSTLACSELCFFPGPTMSGPQTPEPARRTQGDSPTGTGGEDTADGIQHSQRMLSFSDALLSIIATVMVRVPRPLSPPQAASPFRAPGHTLSRQPSGRAQPSIDPALSRQCPGVRRPFGQLDGWGKQSSTGPSPRHHVIRGVVSAQPKQRPMALFVCLLS